MKHNVVLIASALYTNYGVFNADERKQQTLATIESIKKNIPSPIMIIVENSTIAIQDDQSPELGQIIDQVDYFFDNSDDKDIQYFHNNVSNYDIGKNAMETIGFIKAFKHILTDPGLMNIIKNSKRIFKVSGRYKVSDSFNYNQFISPEANGKYVFKKAVQAWIPEADTGVTSLLQTRLFSFDPILFEDTVKMYDEIIQNMMFTFNRQKYIDLEHSMSKFIPKDKLYEVELVGVAGNIAPNGILVED